MNVLSELDANVWKILTKEGASVASGDVLIILESMKMEINVEAPADGRVLKIQVSEGDAVEEEQLLLVLDAG